MPGRSESAPTEPARATTAPAGAAQAEAGHARTELANAGADADVAVPARGERIGRFVVTGLLGRGGMGVVMSARDPQLGREVAIKLVAPSWAACDDDALRLRLLREARAMARLRHPNVISVYEVGEHGGQVYVAMEKIDGETLREAVHQLHRTGGPDWRRVLRLFAEAGRGLAAVHAAGLVHRDFKPENVLVDRDGRVFVGDFGIVHESKAAGEGSAGAADAGVTITRADEVIGTPAYMASEQHHGEIDARADQFAFCVALYEALYGERPFPGDTFHDYVEAVFAGEVRPPPPGAQVPAWLRAVILRGLAVDPGARYASMDELLSEIDVDSASSSQPGRRERTLLIAAAGAYLVAWAVIMLGARVHLTYRIHYATDFAFVGVAVLFGRRLARTPFNRTVYGLCLATAASVLVLTVGGQLAGWSPHSVGLLHLLVIGTVALAGAAVIDRRLAVSAGCYFAAFLGAAARPSLFLPLTLVAHSVLATVGVLILRGRK